MHFLRADGLSLAFGDRLMLDEVQIHLQSGTRLALSGPNGSGKTTFLKVLAGKIEADSGRISTSPEARVSYLPQSGIVFSGGSILEQALLAFSDLEKLWEQRQQNAESLKNDPEAVGAEKLLERIAELDHVLEERSFHHRENECGKILTGLGFKTEELDKDVDEFSGGWQMRTALAKVLLENPDFLLLDEPTNYLDLESITWLENFLSRFSGGILMVSHDRDFLNRNITGVIEIFNAKIKSFPGDYNQYEAARSQEIELLEKKAREVAQERERIEKFIERFRYKDSKAAQVQSRVKALEKLPQITVPSEWRNMHFSFPDPPHSGKEVIRLKALGHSYGGKSVFHGLDQTFIKGEKWVLVGPNGAGKSTLMKILSGGLSPSTGVCELGTGVRPAYFCQDQEKALDPGNTVYEEALLACPTDLIPQLRSRLGAFLFSGDDIEKPVGVLSGGERSRLALVKILLVPTNLLLLDEPTNHLDLASKDILLEALKEYPGTVVFVSHDTYFIRSLATSVLEIRQEPRVYPGDFAYYLSQTLGGQFQKNNSHVLGSQVVHSNAKIERQQRKEREAQIRRAKRKEEEAMVLIENLERDLVLLQAAMGLQENYSDSQKAQKLQNQIREKEGSLEVAQSDWEKAAEELENLGSPNEFK
jgi:ATP-binding cassette subfamily F protein 3